MRRRPRDHLGPERALELALDLALVSPGGMRAAMNAFMRARDRRARLVERRVARRTDHLALELAERRMALAREPPGASASSEQQRRAASRGERLLDALRRASPSSRRRHVRDDPARAVDEERLGHAGDARTSCTSMSPLPSRPLGYVSPYLRTKLARVPREVLVVDADDDEPSAYSSKRPGGAAPRRGTARTRTPRNSRRCGLPCSDREASLPSPSSRGR